MRAFGWVQEGVCQNLRLLDTSQRPAYQRAMVQRRLAFIMELVVLVLAPNVVTVAIQLRSNTAFIGASLVVLITFGNCLAQIISIYRPFRLEIADFLYFQPPYFLLS